MKFVIENKVKEKDCALLNDSDLIEFVLMQLIENSIKYSKKSTNVKLKTFEVLDDPSLVGFEVLDQG